MTTSTKTWIGILVIIIIIAGTIVILNQKKSRDAINEQGTYSDPAGNISIGNPTSATPNAVDTSTWKTYTNKSYGFSIQYPASYSVTEGSKSVLLKDDSGLEQGKQASLEIFHEKDSVKNEVANIFIAGTNTDNPDLKFATLPAVIFSYFTGDAYSADRTYLFAKGYPSIPGDPGKNTTDIIRIHAQQSITDQDFQQLTKNNTLNYSVLPWQIDQIVATLKYIN